MSALDELEWFDRRSWHPSGTGVGFTHRIRDAVLVAIKLSGETCASQGWVWRTLPLSLDLRPGVLLQPCSRSFRSAYLCLKQVRKGHWSCSGLHSHGLIAGLDMSKTAVGQPLRARSSVREAQPRAQETPCLAQDDLGRKGERGP